MLSPTRCFLVAVALGAAASGAVDAAVAAGKVNRELMSSLLRSGKSAAVLATADPTIAEDTRSMMAVSDKCAVKANHGEDTNNEFQRIIDELSIASDDSMWKIKMKTTKLLRVLKAKIREEFDHLECAVIDTVNKVLGAVCANHVHKSVDHNHGTMDASCWAAMKVECQAYDVKAHIHTLRRKIANFVNDKLTGKMQQFIDTVKDRKLAPGSTKTFGDIKHSDYTKGASASCTEATVTETCHTNLYIEILAIFGPFLQEGDAHALGEGKGAVTSKCNNEWQNTLTSDAHYGDCDGKSTSGGKMKCYIEKLSALAPHRDHAGHCSEFTQCMANADQCEDVSKVTVTENMRTAHPECDYDPIQGENAICASRMHGLKATSTYQRKDGPCEDERLGLLGVLATYAGKMTGTETGQCNDVIMHTNYDEATGENSGTCANQKYLGKIGEIIDLVFECALGRLDHEVMSCSEDDAKTEHDRCINGACDCACVCGQHLSTEQMDKECADHPYVKNGQTFSGYTAAGVATCGADTCANSDWRASNKCPTEDGKPHNDDCASTQFRR